jgi:hypothetical protein
LKRAELERGAIGIIGVLKDQAVLRVNGIERDSGKRVTLTGMF